MKYVFRFMPNFPDHFRAGIAMCVPPSTKIPKLKSSCQFFIHEITILCVLLGHLMLTATCVSWSEVKEDLSWVGFKLVLVILRGACVERKTTCVNWSGWSRWHKLSRQRLSRYRSWWRDTCIHTQRENMVILFISWIVSRRNNRFISLDKTILWLYIFIMTRLKRRNWSTAVMPAAI
jgi:hypothetical protein